ncbi:peroxidase 45-like [Miscanthus floridulus]|uniref:peroxidase 45-like n=1 Tax=Miscanthus floridulus TaxID=154761 RepID=UPI003458E9AE
MDPGFTSQLNDTCSSDPNAFAFLDPSPVGSDNAFYRNLQVGKGLLGSDQVLYSDMRSRSTVDYYASNQGAFFSDFMAGMTKLGRIGVKTSATSGEIRQNCRFPN